MSERNSDSRGGGGGGHTSSSSSGALQIHSLYIINKAGGLIYQKDFSPVPKLSTNDYLRLASTFHSLHAITARGVHVLPALDRKTAAAAAAAASAPDALPRPPEGMQSLEARDFRLQCFQTLTGIKFLLVASPNFSAATLDKLLQGVYHTYADHVLKNPFYELEMPIRIETFDAHLLRLIQGAVGGGYGGSTGGGGDTNRSGGGDRRDR